MSRRNGSNLPISISRPVCLRRLPRPKAPSEEVLGNRQLAEFFAFQSLVDSINKACELYSKHPNPIK